MTFNDISQVIKSSINVESFKPNRISDDKYEFRMKAKDSKYRYDLEYFNNSVNECYLSVFHNSAKIAAHYGDFVDIIESIKKYENK